MAVKIFKFADPSELADKMTVTISQLLRKTIEEKQQAVIGVSGGSTPAILFEKLSAIDLPWPKITVTLVDERCVDPSSSESNSRQVHDKLLQGKAVTANFFPLVSKAESTAADLVSLEKNFRANSLLPLDIAILGMGNDGHTASLFPCSATIKALMDNNSRKIFHLVEPATAPYKRITLSLSALLQSRHLILHIVGNHKLQVLDQALSGVDSLQMPIRAFLHHPDINIDIYWSPSQGELQ